MDFIKRVLAIAISMSFVERVWTDAPVLGSVLSTQITLASVAGVALGVWISSRRGR